MDCFVAAYFAFSKYAKLLAMTAFLTSPENECGFLLRNRVNLNAIPSPLEGEGGSRGARDGRGENVKG
jgi:hypothetical protein